MYKKIKALFILTQWLVDGKRIIITLLFIFFIIVIGLFWLAFTVGILTLLYFGAIKIIY